MPRNSSGTYSTPAGQPVVSGTVISSTTFNSLVSDLSSEVTDSLSRSGKGGMQASLRNIDGTLAAPALSFNNESGTGFWRNAAGDLRLSVLGVLRQRWEPTGIFSVSAVADGATAVGHTFDTTTALANAGAKIASWQTGGTERAFLSAVGTLTFPSTTTPQIVSSAGNSSLQLAGNKSAADGFGDVYLGSTATRTAGTLLQIWNNLYTGAVKASFDFNGYLILAGANPASSTAISNTLTPKNTVKAWALLTLGAAGAVTVTDGFNVTSAAWSTTDLTVTLASAMASANYAVTGASETAGGTMVNLKPASKTTTTFILNAWVSNVNQNWANGNVVSFIVVGPQ